MTRFRFWHEALSLGAVVITVALVVICEPRPLEYNREAVLFDAATIESRAWITGERK